MHFSLIAPCFNEAKNLPALFEAMTDCFDAEDFDYEIIFVNDGSTDETMETLEGLIGDYESSEDAHAQVSVIEFSRNFGKEAAMYAGLQAATGEMVGFIDADMQQDPRVALKMLRFLENNSYYDCVAAVQKNRKDSMLYGACSHVFYRTFKNVSNTEVIENASDFRVFRRPVADALLSMGEHDRFSKGLFSWVGFRTFPMEYEANERLHGESKWSLGKLVRYAWNGIIGFSALPLRVFAVIGISITVVAFILLSAELVQSLVKNSQFVTIELLLYVILFMGGLQMVGMSIHNEYLSRTYDETRKRPIYIARSAYTFYPGVGVAESKATAQSSTARVAVRRPAVVEANKATALRKAASPAGTAAESNRITHMKQKTANDGSGAA